MSEDTNLSMEEIEELERMEAESSQPSIKTFINIKKMKEDLAFTDADLSDGFMNQAALFAHYAHRAHQAALQVDRFKHTVEILEARLDRAIRDEAAEAGRKVTEKAIEAAIKCDDRHINAVKRLNEAKMIAGLCKDAAEAFRHRRDMLIQMGADIRQEKSGELRMKSPGETARDRAKEIIRSSPFNV